MGHAAAALGWSPATFWHSTPHEYFAAMEAWEQLLPVLSPNPLA
jgi:hypothetical protein